MGCCGGVQNIFDKADEITTVTPMLVINQSQAEEKAVLSQSYQTGLCICSDQNRTQIKLQFTISIETLSWLHPLPLDDELLLHRRPDQVLPQDVDSSSYLALTPPIPTILVFIKS